MKTYLKFYSFMGFMLLSVVSFIDYVCNAVYDTFILPLVNVVTDFFESLVEKVSVAKNYTETGVSDSASSKSWMYDMFSRWRVDPAV